MSVWLQAKRWLLRKAWVRALIPSLVLWAAVVGLVSGFSDIGFAQLIDRHRWLIIALLPLFLVVEGVYWCWSQHRELVGVREALRQAQAELDAERRNVERHLLVIQGYEAQEWVLDELRRRAIYRLKEVEWRKKGACVTELIVENGPGLESLEPEDQLRERATVYINLGIQDDVIDGMVFNVVNKVDPSRAYGQIVVVRVEVEGALCRLQGTGDPAFWSEAFTALQEVKSRALSVTANRIIPAATLEGVDSDAAKELLYLIERVQKGE